MVVLADVVVVVDVLVVSVAGTHAGALRPSGPVPSPACIFPRCCVRSA